MKYSRALELTEKYVISFTTRSRCAYLRHDWLLREIRRFPPGCHSIPDNRKPPVARKTCKIARGSSLSRPSERFRTFAEARSVLDRLRVTDRARTTMSILFHLIFTTTFFLTGVRKSHLTVTENWGMIGQTNGSFEWKGIYRRIAFA